MIENWMKKRIGKGNPRAAIMEPINDLRSGEQTAQQPNKRKRSECKSKVQCRLKRSPGPIPTRLGPHPARGGHLGRKWTPQGPPFWDLLKPFRSFSAPFRSLFGFVFCFCFPFFFRALFRRLDLSKSDRFSRNNGICEQSCFLFADYFFLQSQIS